MNKNCRDCVHEIPDGRSGEFNKCGRPGGNVSYCSTEIQDWSGLDVCGPARKYFEKKPREPRTEGNYDFEWDPPEMYAWMTD